MSVILIGGGSASGKSRYALQRARQCEHPIAFIATAENLGLGIPADFDTYVEPIELARFIDQEGSRYGAIVVACLTQWLSNLLAAGSHPDIPSETAKLLRACGAVAGSVFLITSEVGCGTAPEPDEVRGFRDVAGVLNQSAAAAASEVYWMAFGIPLRVK